MRKLLLLIIALAVIVIPVVAVVYYLRRYEVGIETLDTAEELPVN